MQSGNTFTIGIELENWGRVYSDPEPPFDLEQLVADIYADRPERGAVRDDPGLEDEFVAALPNNAVVDLS